MQELQLQKNAERESAEVGKKLAKIAEQKLKSIDISLDTYKRKNKTDFPVKSASKSEYVEGRGLFSSGRKRDIASIDVGRKIGKLDLSDIMVGVSSDGSPMKDSFKFHIMNDRFVTCDDVYYMNNEDRKFFESFKVPKTSAVKEEKTYTGKPNKYCHTMTSPMKVYLLPRIYGMEYDSDYLGKEFYLELKDEDLAKSKKIIEKNPKYEHALNSNIWLAANGIIDELQTSMVNAARQSAKQVDAAQAYLEQSEVKKFTL